MQKIGYNIHDDENGLKDHIKKINAPVHLVLENYGLAHDIAIANPNVQVIYRPYFPQSDAYHKIMRPNEFVAKMKQLWQGEPNIWFHTGNEAGLDLDLQNWEMALAASPVGMKFVLGNPSTGTIPDSIEGWKYAAKYIKFLVDNKDKFWLGLHEYFDVIPCLTMPNFASRVHDWNGLTRPAWQVNRFRWLIDYCDSVGLAYPNIVITEFGNDDLKENRDNSPVNAFLATVRHNPQYYNIRGWKSLQDQWAEWYKKPADQTYFDMGQWAEDNVYNHPAIRGVCTFCWCKPSSEWDQFNLAYAMNYRTSREAYAPVPSAEKFGVADSIYNLRESTSTTSKRLQLIQAGTSLWIDTTPIHVGSHDWYKVRTSTNVGYVRGDVLTLTVTHVATASYGVNIRMLPDIKANILGALRSGDQFSLTGRTDGIWVEVNKAGLIGWCSNQVLTYV
jgi:hypothetical protein